MTAFREAWAAFRTSGGRGAPWTRKGHVCGPLRMPYARVGLGRRPIPSPEIVGRSRNKGDFAISDGDGFGAAVIGAKAVSEVFAEGAPVNSTELGREGVVGLEEGSNGPVPNDFAGFVDYADVCKFHCGPLGECAYKIAQDALFVKDYFRDLFGAGFSSGRRSPKVLWMPL